MIGRRILVIGCGGAGKSTLARQLAEVLQIPVYHLDQIYWKANWKESTQEEFELAQREILDSPAWVIDGNYGGTMALRLEQADSVVYLDFSTATCLRGAFRRYLKYRGTTRPDMTEGNRERLALDYLAWILVFRRRKRLGVLARIRPFEDRLSLHVLTRRAQADDLLEQIKSAN